MIGLRLGIPHTMSAAMRRSIVAGARVSVRLETHGARIGAASATTRLGVHGSFARACQMPALATGGATQSRAFSVQTPRRMADVQEKFDPSAIDRESDEVDVCIVGGGTSSHSSVLSKTGILRGFC